MSTLYNLSEEYLQLINFIELSGDEEIPKVIDEKLEQVEDDIDAKVENIAKIIQEKQGELEAIKYEADRLNRLKKRKENEIERLTEWAYSNLKRVGKKSIKSDIFDIKIKKNPPKVNILDSTLIPEEYIKTKTSTSIDKITLRRDLKEGLIVDGAELIQEEKLQIK